ncbi:fused MFS/spermidine synthase [Patescibacteria group bacterium]|nr:fused MFS/spermidine synthase [Patescibacteria group bacterium]
MVPFLRFKSTLPLGDPVMLYFTIFSTNAAILIFEIAGAHLLAPYLGTSVEVWSGTIAVILGGMAIGYWVAGIIADQRSSRAMLSLLMCASGLAALLAWSTRDLIPSLFATSFSLPLTFTAMATAALLFLPTTILLASISPFVAKALIVHLESSGRVVGRLNAIGTLGSITGAVITSTFLIPSFGVGAIFLCIALFLLALSFVLGVSHLKMKLAALVIVSAISFSLYYGPTHTQDAIADISTTYNRIWIVEDEYRGEMLRMLKTDPFGIQCAMLLLPDGTVDETTLSFNYLRGFEAVAREVAPQEEVNALFLGGCNYSHPRAFLSARPDARATVVEIDPGMTEVAETYFGFVPENFPSLSIAHADARRFLVEHEQDYDLIFMDVFNASSNTPYHLTTTEMFTLLSERVTPEGVVMVNLISPLEGGAGAFASSMLATARTAFPYVELYAQDNTALSQTQNVLLVGSTVPLAERYGSTRVDGVRLSRVDDALLPPSIILNDDFAPVEFLTRQIRGSSL